MAFLELINHRLDEVKQRLSYAHYMDTVYHAKRWVKRWSKLTCNEITIELITKLRDERGLISNQTANKELRYLRSLFNWGVKKAYIENNPASRVDMLRVIKKEIYVPPIEDIIKIFQVANDEQRDYLWCLRDTFARSCEINNLKWVDINFENKTIILYTRKKRHGTKTPRIIPLTHRLYDVLLKRYDRKTDNYQFVFWHRYYSRKIGKSIIGPYQDRKKFMRSLCTKAEVRYFRFHPFRHAGASFLEHIGVSIIDIQSLLGHSNRKTTEGYIHTTPKSKITAINKYEDANKLLVDSKT